MSAKKTKYTRNYTYISKCFSIFYKIGSLLNTGVCLSCITYYIIIYIINYKSSRHVFGIGVWETVFSTGQILKYIGRRL